MKENKRHILVAVAGETPAIITETLWHITQKEKIPISEIHVLTTTVGRERIKSALLDPKKGIFFAFLKEYGIDPKSIRFGEDTIHVLKGDKGKSLEDIRSDKDNLHAANHIAQVVRELTEKDDSILHCSVAGGRKTMTVYLAFALQLFGRPGDTLSHVLVNKELERSPDFYYIPKNCRGISFRTATRKPFPASKAKIEVASVPFVRLRHRLPSMFSSADPSFNEMVTCAQEELDAPLLQIDTWGDRLIVGDVTIKLSEAEMNTYWYFANRKIAHCENKHGNCFGCTKCFVRLTELENVDINSEPVREIAAMREREPLPEDEGESSDYLQVIRDNFCKSIRVHITRIGKKLKARLDARQYQQVRIGPDLPHTKKQSYGILLPRNKIKPLER